MELIPITHFDQRNFPELTEDDKTDFITHTNSLESAFAAPITPDQVKSAILFPQQADPLISGQMRCLEMITGLAKNQNLIPKHTSIDSKNFDKLFPWLTNLHGNVLYDLALKGEKLNNYFEYPLKEELGKYRKEEKTLGHRKMPHPSKIKDLLVSSFQEYSKIYHKYHNILSTPQMMETEDWKRLEEAAYKVNLDICCIKPFKDGSNRVARLVENLLRLNTGLRFKIIENKQKLLNDIWQLQDEEYRTVD